MKYDWEKLKREAGHGRWSVGAIAKRGNDRRGVCGDCSVAGVGRDLGAGVVRRAVDLLCGVPGHCGLHRDVAGDAGGRVRRIDSLIH